MDSENFDDFCIRITDFVFNRIKPTIAEMLNMEKDSIKEIEEYISFMEVKILIKEIVNSKTTNFEKISEKKVVKICEALNKRIFSNILNKLSGEGYLDCAWSEADESFVFKVSEEGLKKGISIPKIFRP